MKTLKYSITKSFEHPEFYEAWMYPDLESKEPALVGISRNRDLAVALLMDKYAAWLRAKRLEQVLLSVSAEDHSQQQA